MSFGQAIWSCFSNYVTFSGQATRSEYWYWCLFVIIGGICALIVDSLTIGGMVTQPINFIFTLVTFLPGLAVSVRRLHDVNKSGWWLLIMFTGIGALLLLYWMLLPSREKKNNF